MSACGSIVGGVVSRTMTLKLPEPVLPCESVAWHVTSVAPIGNVDPEEKSHVVDADRSPSTVSLAETEKETAAPAALVASATTSVPVTTGGVVSCTVTENDAVLVRPPESVATHVTVVVPNPNVASDATTVEPGSVHTGVSVPSSTSVAVAVNVTA